MEAPFNCSILVFSSTVQLTLNKDSSTVLVEVNRMLPGCQVWGCGGPEVGLTAVVPVKDWGWMGCVSMPGTVDER